jgi:DNA-binding FrmR family transcriptional regulator
MAKKKPAKKRSLRRSGQPSPGGERGLADRLAAGIDPAAKAAILTRLRRAKGQAAGIERMIENERECAEIITQIIAARASLMAVAKALLKDHMKRSHILASQSGEMEVDDMYQDLVDLLTKMAR